MNGSDDLLPFEADIERQLLRRVRFARLRRRASGPAGLCSVVLVLALFGFNLNRETPAEVRQVAGEAADEQGSSGERQVDGSGRSDFESDERNGVEAPSSANAVVQVTPTRMTADEPNVEAQPEFDPAEASSSSTTSTTAPVGPISSSTPSSIGPSMTETYANIWSVSFSGEVGVGEDQALVTAVFELNLLDPCGTAIKKQTGPTAWLILDPGIEGDCAYPGPAVDWLEIGAFPVGAHTVTLNETVHHFTVAASQVVPPSPPNNETEQVAVVEVVFSELPNTTGSDDGWMVGATVTYGLPQDCYVVDAVRAAPDVWAVERRRAEFPEYCSLAMVPVQHSISFVVGEFFTPGPHEVSVNGANYWFELPLT